MSAFVPLLSNNTCTTSLSVGVTEIVDLTPVAAFRFNALSVVALPAIEWFSKYHPDDDVIAPTGAGGTDGLTGGATTGGTTTGGANPFPAHPTHRL